VVGAVQMDVAADGDALTAHGQGGALGPVAVVADDLVGEGDRSGLPLDTDDDVAAPALAPAHVELADGDRARRQQVDRAAGGLGAAAVRDDGTRLDDVVVGGQVDLATLTVGRGAVRRDYS